MPPLPKERLVFLSKALAAYTPFRLLAAPFRLTTFGTLPEGQAQGVFSLDIYLKFK